MRQPPTVSLFLPQRTLHISHSVFRQVAWFTIPLILWGTLTLSSTAVAQQDDSSRSGGSAEVTGIRVPDGFQIELFADDDLAHDIYCMTIDSQGRVVVSGPGYIRILRDNDHDGRADSYHEVCQLPETGAQGMYWLGSHLLVAGDEGLLLIRDTNGDDIPDGPPTTFLKISAGGEHHVHSIQKGPDGWWYVIAGNFAGVTSNYASLPTSPIREPINGTLFRLKPDLSGAEIVADGFRNAYDFAFGPGGEVFTFDSDDERDVSLPWYQPTRVFQVTPLSNSGWVSEGWKRPASSPDMPPVVADFGRGSPTGVICYQGLNFPEEWDNVILTLDWTMGRILAVRLKPHASGWRGEQFEFAAGQNQFGFAPTDLEAGPDGSLYVCVGGRGTRGGVFRIFHSDTAVKNAVNTPARKSGIRTAAATGSELEVDRGRPASAIGTEAPPTLLQTPEEQTVDQRVTAVLDAPQPLSAWSRRQWMPAANRLGRDVFREAALNAGRTTRQRTRAIEIMTELFQGLDTPAAMRLTESPDVLVRARTAWSLGRSNPSAPEPAVIQILSRDPAPMVRRAAMESLTSMTERRPIDTLIPTIATALGDADHGVRLAAASLISRMSDAQQTALRAHTAGNSVATLWMFIGLQLRKSTVNVEAAEYAGNLLTDQRATPETRQESVRLLQLALSDVGPAAGRPAAFDSYSPQRSLEEFDIELNPVRAALGRVFPSGNPALDRELIRVIAMTSPLNREQFTAILAGVTADSHPTDDLHRLYALAQFEIERSYDETMATARALVGIEVKIRRMGLRLDTNWDDRTSELYEALCVVDPVLPQLIAEQSDLGLPGHVVLTEKMPQEAIEKAISAFVAAIQSDPDYEWSNDVVFLLAESTTPAHQQLLRMQLSNPVVRDAVLIVLADAPEKEDRELFLEGLTSPQLNAVDACVKALTHLPRNNAAAEQFVLLSAARRLSDGDREYRIRSTIMRLLQNNTGQDLGFDFGSTGLGPQPAAMNNWQIWLERRYPEYQPPVVEDSARRILAMLPDVNWEQGDAKRGEKLFQRLSCSRCHGGRQALGPDLLGVARR
ncbi:MAG: HEAT repeat domain-containing protein, partial [Planctomycetaceae bacterium]|nr:HEAT repeat domain-containing protein [Planctomycetaceae bacterium]